MRYLVAVMALGLVIARAVWAEIRVDEISLVLLLLAALAFFWRDIAPVAGRIHRFKLWEVEFELTEEISKLTQRAEEAAREASLELESVGREAPTTVPPEATQWVGAAAADPRAGVLLAAIEIEQAIRRLAAQYGIASGVGRLSARRALAELAKREVVAREVVALFDDFWQVRNRVVHDAGFQLPAGQLYELLDVAFRILELVSLGQSATVGR